ncbi:MAG: hypothetical protein LBV07_01680 [Syntrophobacterales bacterium]|jgi:hypothetical protein|nr:hypothetical protein [Syntrophobacterales bacterium]
MKTVAEQNNSRVYPKWLTFKMGMGIFLILLSYIIGWPGVAFFAWLSLYLKNPLWIAVGGPVIYGISHLVFLWGAYLVGERYLKSFWKRGKGLISRKSRHDQQADPLKTGTTINDKKE